MLLVTEKHPEKNPVWAIHTPNEIYNNPGLSAAHLQCDYRALEGPWAAHWDIPGKKLWVEKRVNATQSRIITDAGRRWWDDPMFGDAIFWCYSTPFLIELDGDSVFVFALEYCECQRVRAALYKKYGREVTHSEFPIFVLPEDVIHTAWEETSRGYSDHLRPRPEVTPTAAQEDAEEAKKGAVAQKIKEIEDVAEEEFERVVGPSALEDEVA